LKIPARIGTEEIARAVGINRETVLRAHRRGDLKSGVQIGRSVSFDGNSVVEWLQSRGIVNVLCVDSEVHPK
jgi:predicted DNA-binding transcriptional regulator AlpA